jgi:hypothetical protein
MSDATRLVRFLQRQYELYGNVMSRPVLDTARTVEVRLDLSLIQIQDVDEQNQVLVTSNWNNYVSNNFTVRVTEY